MRALPQRRRREPSAATAASRCCVGVGFGRARDGFPAPLVPMRVPHRHRRERGYVTRAFEGDRGRVFDGECRGAVPGGRGARDLAAHRRQFAFDDGLLGREALEQLVHVGHQRLRHRAEVVGNVHRRRAECAEASLGDELVAAVDLAHDPGEHCAPARLVDVTRHEDPPPSSTRRAAVPRACVLLPPWSRPCRRSRRRAA